MCLSLAAIAGCSSGPSYDDVIAMRAAQSEQERIANAIQAFDEACLATAPSFKGAADIIKAARARFGVTGTVGYRGTCIITLSDAEASSVVEAAINMMRDRNYSMHNKEPMGKFDYSADVTIKGELMELQIGSPTQNSIFLILSPT